MAHLSGHCHIKQRINTQEKAKLAADAGFDAIEPWDRELQKHENRGNLKFG